MERNTSLFNSFSDMLRELEQLAEDQQGMLVGGFVSMSGNALSEIQDPMNNDKCTNNCNGGNCVKFCGFG